MALDTAIRRSPYWPVLTHPSFRRVLPGLFVSALGDGMGLLAVSWLAMQLAPAAHRGTWIGVAVAAYTLPGAVGTVAFGRWLRGHRGARLAGWDAALRCAALAAIPVAHLAGVLGIELYVVLLATSALLHSWGSAGRFTLIAEIFTARHRLPANAVLTTISEFATIVGPPLAGLLAGWVGVVWVLAIDAGTFAVLALTYRLALPPGDRAAPSPTEPLTTDRATPAAGGSSRGEGFAVLRRNPELLGLLGLTFGFFFLFGPVYVALPLLVVGDLHGSAATLGAFYTAFGVGALMGGLGTGYLRRWRRWPAVLGIVTGFGAAMLPLGLGAPTALALGCMGVAGLAWAPYMSMSMSIFQQSVDTARLPQVLAANGAVTVLAVPLGSALGGPLTAALGARGTLLVEAVGTVALGAVDAGILLARRAARPGGRADESGSRAAGSRTGVPPARSGG
ncbi:MFS transporter [Plantactinospora siamensis]|uniref:MFS transporter n=1 Tax=Plantactinospora siamensis TaxID=555372 RepID=A0ABV6NSZ4_9ACTN